MITENGLWVLRHVAKNEVSFASTFTWKRNYRVNAYLDYAQGTVIYHNPKNVHIPKYVHLEVFKLLTFGATYFSITRSHREFDVSLVLNQQDTTRSERPNYDYSVYTPTGVYFGGNQFAPMLDCLDSEEQIIDDLLLWLCVKPGDTDKKYFSDYTPKQLEWANSPECELMAAELSD